MKDKGFNPQEVINCLHLAKSLAQKHNHQYVTLEHLLAALLEQPDVQEVIAAFKVDPKELAAEVDRYLQAGFVPVSSKPPVETDALANSVRLAVGQVKFSQRTKAMPVDLLVSLLQQDDSHAQAFLNNAGITALEVKRHLSHGSEDALGETAAPFARELASLDEAQKILDRYCVNLNEQATQSKIDPLIGRTEEILQLIQNSARRTKNNSILVGESGVGKTQLVEGLALKIVRHDVPAIIADATVYALDIGALVAGTRFRGDFEERIKIVLKALSFVPKPILFIDEVHNIIGAGGTGNQGAMDASNLLKPALAKGALRCIGSTTYDEYRKHFEKDRALMRRFRKIDVEEPSAADAKLILRGLRGYYEDYHSVKFTDAALDAAVDLTVRHVKNQFLPDKAIDVIDNAGARQRIVVESARKAIIDIGEIEWEVGKLAKIPPQTVAEDERAKLQRLDSDLRQQVFGQDAALQTLTEAVQVSRAGLREPNKPAGAYLFAGPSGCGKTQTARQLAATLGIELIKFDMSEYMEKHSVARLIGAPPGYVGHGEGGAGAGLLTNAVETHPHCVLLLDEVEKAHPEVFNILLQVMDDAKLTNSSGKTVNFESVFLIMTTNAGAADMARAAIGFGDTLRDGEDDIAITKLFAPEFRNRLDAIVKFGRLTNTDMLRVVTKFIEQLGLLAAPRGIILKLTDPAREWLARKGFDPQMGARPLARLITEHVKKPLAKLLLFADHQGTVTIKVKNDALVLVGT